jgi:cytochrome c oxidase cbb3-type subunit 1
VNAHAATRVRRHSLGWLVAANAVGLWLAFLLLWPDAGDALAPLTYGRWVPLHLDWMLYGWSALPLVGVLFVHYLPDDGRGAFMTKLTLWIWSAALLFGGRGWLSGKVAGKLFLDWTDASRTFWSFASLVLWVGLLWQARRRPDLGRWSWSLLLALGLVPVALYAAAAPDSYPPVNPHSGGATGSSLLGSTLGVVGIFGLVPWLLRLPTITDSGKRRRWFAAALALAFAFFAGMGHGDASNRRPDQIIGLGSLVIWLPLVWWYARSFTWADNSGRWLGAAFVWWCLLVVTGWLSFLPGIAERVKFTNVLVAHSHLAMAGLVTSFNVALLLNLGPARAPSRRSFWFWQAGCALHVGALLWLGWQEGAEPSLLYLRGGVADVCYGLRLLAGLVMFAASINWLATLGRHADHSA